MIIDALATRYHYLPSEVLRRSDTLDLLIMDVSTAWHRMQEEQAQAKASGKPPKPNLPVNKLQEMIDSVRSKQ